MFAVIIMTIVVIFLVTEGVHVFPPGKFFFFSYKASFKRCRNRRSEAGPSQPASLQTRAHLVCLRVWFPTMSITDNTQHMWSELLGLYTGVSLPKGSPSPDFFWLQRFGSKAQEAPCSRSKTPQWTLLPSVHQFTCRSGVLREWEESIWFCFGTWIKHQKVSKMGSTWIPSSSQCRSTPTLLFYIYI